MRPRLSRLDDALPLPRCGERRVRGVRCLRWIGRERDRRRQPDRSSSVPAAAGGKEERSSAGLQGGCLSHPPCAGRRRRRARRTGRGSASVCATQPPFDPWAPRVGSVPLSAGPPAARCWPLRRGGYQALRLKFGGGGFCRDCGEGEEASAGRDVVWADDEGSVFGRRPARLARASAWEEERLVCVPSLVSACPRVRASRSVACDASDLQTALQIPPAASSTEAVAQSSSRRRGLSSSRRDRARRAAARRRPSRRFCRGSPGPTRRRS